MNIHLKKQATWMGLFCLLVALPLSAQNTTPSPTDSVTFQADHIAYDIQTKRVILTGQAILHYRNLVLSAGQIAYDRQTRLVEAQALPDSNGAETVGIPNFMRGSEHLYGTYMIYNLDTEQGRVKGGRAQHERKYYQGERIVMDGQEALNALDLSISTCDKDHVHYDFLCKNVRIVQNDKAIGRSVTFRIGPIPIFWVPFFVFPIKQGRQSGLLTPSVGSNSRDGLFVRNLGYYFAPSDYWDATLKGTFRERGGFLLETGVVYAVRNRLSGNIDISYEHDTQSTGSLNNWQVNLQHQQRLNATTNIRGSGQFSTSTGFDQRNSDNLYHYLNRQLRSSFSFDKRWNDSGRSMDGSLTYYRDLENKSNSFQGFPRLSFRQGRRSIFGTQTNIGKTWYQQIYYDFSSQLSNAFTKHSDPSKNTENLTLQGFFSLNSQHKLGGWLDLNPSFSLSEQFEKSSTDTITRRESYQVSANTGTTFYGIFQPQIGRLRGIRHRLQPRITFSQNQTTKITGGTFGFSGTRTWEDARRSLGFNLGNSVELKTEKEGHIRRFTFATLNMSTGYDFDSPAQKWQPLQTSAAIKPDQHLDMRLTMIHRFYNTAGTIIAKPQLQSFTMTSSVRFQGRTASQTQPDNSSLLQNPTSFQDLISEFGFERDVYTDSGNNIQPWRLTLTHYYSLQQAQTALSPRVKRSWIKADFGINPLRTLRIDYAINIDLMPSRGIIAQNLSFYRDLHCWEARLAWYPTGYNRGFYLKINIKDIPQIKFEHRQGGFGL